MILKKPIVVNGQNQLGQTLHNESILQSMSAKVKVKGSTLLKWLHQICVDVASY